MKSGWNDPWIGPPEDPMVRTKIKKLGGRWLFLFSMGLISVVLGILAILLPVATTVGLTFMLAALLLAGGLLFLFHAFRLRGEDGSSGRFLQSILAIVVGVLMFRFPEGGMMGIALALGFYFFIRAAAEWLLYSSLPYVRERRWGYFSAAMSFFLGVLVVAYFPFSALWIPGLLLGLDLIFAGAVAMAFALALRRAVKKIEGARSSVPVRVT